MGDIIDWLCSVSSVIVTVVCRSLRSKVVPSVPCVTVTSRLPGNLLNTWSQKSTSSRWGEPSGSEGSHWGSSAPLRGHFCPEGSLCYCWNKNPPPIRHAQGFLLLEAVVLGQALGLCGDRQIYRCTSVIRQLLVYRLTAVSCSEDLQLLLCWLCFLATSSLPQTVCYVLTSLLSSQSQDVK